MKKPMTPSDYIKNQPHLQGRTLTPNPYSALAEYPPLFYAKAVAKKNHPLQRQEKPKPHQLFNLQIPANLFYPRPWFNPSSYNKTFFHPRISYRRLHIYRQDPFDL
ncbi:BnaC02g29580D [Brassica napus]|uniref:BnaC02g29580D protein n=1 Tax=Brassica napus TaxID=3708 RepID=A0A078GBS7_BRANA|nr:BnaC02g29580D [Brassica napus]